jgi:hypothetical protein
LVINNSASLPATVATEAGLAEEGQSLDEQQTLNVAKCLIYRAEAQRPGTTTVVVVVEVIVLVVVVVVVVVVLVVVAAAAAVVVVVIIRACNSARHNTH